MRHILDRPHSRHSSVSGQIKPGAVRLRQRGATLVEFVVVTPTLLFMLLALIDYGMLFHTKSQVNYATYEAARAGSVSNANPVEIRKAFLRAMTGYYGGGGTTSQLAQSYAKAVADSPYVQIEILSPTKESFDDYNSPALAAKLKIKSRVIPNSNLAFIKCPIDVPGCKSDPKTNASGQTLADANLLKIRITYGIPESKQIPFVRRFMSWILDQLNASDTDPFRQFLINAKRTPIVAHTVIRMQSPAYENGNASNPGPGNDGEPVDPDPGPGNDPGDDDPPCPKNDPECTEEPPCDPSTDPNGCLPPGCEEGDPSCDPGCGKDYCCLLREGQIDPEDIPPASNAPNKSPTLLESIR